MSPVMERVRKRCFWCGKMTDHDKMVTVKVFEDPHDFTHSTTIFIHQFRCQTCKTIKKE